ncbi:MAG: HEPN domain-containing protein [Thaumarchaeota archaeon]|jgi:HEPN domain-containing protein|nr:HEPN domain-containing protein [Nitrososphaerota archaeon]
MRSDIMAMDYLRRAKSRLIDAGSAFRRGDYPETVRYSQECVELSLKACLRAVAVEYPKVHDVGDILKICSGKFPDWMKKEIDTLAEISRDLSEKRAPSMYGLESVGKAPSQLFDEKDAEDALNKAEYVHKISSKFLEEFYG